MEEKRERSKRKRKKRAWWPQTTKIIVFSILMTYHIAFFTGIAIVAKETDKLEILLAFTGSVSVFAVAFYCWKSKAENLLKIKKNNPKLEGTLSDFSNMSSQ